MTEDYTPHDDFLKALLDDAVSLTGDQAAKNLQRLIALTQDDDPVNRDWASLLLSLEEIDTPEVRAALLKVATEDNCLAARAEAILGLARRAPDEALPLVRRALASNEVTAPILEAAEVLSDKSLVDILRPYTYPSGNKYLDNLALDALCACGGVTST